jgi:putative transcriptional regulator
MTPTAVEAAARADRDAQPLTAGDFKRMKRTPQAKIIRRALVLTQEEFAVRYHIPWELCGTGSKAGPNRTVPLKPILKIIASEPERVERLLNQRA